MASAAPHGAAARIGDEDADTDWPDQERKHARRRHRPDRPAGLAACRPARRGDPEAARYARPSPFGQGGSSPRRIGAAHRGSCPSSQISAPAAGDRPRLCSASGRGRRIFAPAGTSGDREAAWRRQPRATPRGSNARRAIGRGGWKPHHALARRAYGNTELAAAAAGVPALCSSTDAPARRHSAATGDAEENLRLG